MNVYVIVNNRIFVVRNEFKKEKFLYNRNVFKLFNFIGVCFRVSFKIELFLIRDIKRR